MDDMSEQAHIFLSNLSNQEQKELLIALTRIIKTYQTDKKTTSRKTLLFENSVVIFNRFLKFHQLLQFKNLYNDELVIREVQENFLFVNRKFLQIFYNCEELPFAFIEQLCQLLKTKQQITVLSFKSNKI